ncbi:MAG TPA: outer membrane beta-barrel protein [Steroidobacteraceae bacterium]|nr:outer membrane beta-barrel protein [Steroidobacteraceae bacterium]
MKARSLVWLMLLGATSVQAADGETPDRTRWWFEAGAGFATVGGDRESSGRGSQDGISFDFAGGMRVGDHWLVGLDIGSIITDSYDLYFGSQGRSLSHLFLMADYNARADGGWLFHVGAGFTDFTDSELTTAAAREGHGPAFEAGIGYAWRPSRSNYIVLRGIYEFGRIEANNGVAAESESFNYSAPRLSVSWQFRTGNPR